MTVKVNRHPLGKGLYVNTYISQSHEQSDMDTTMDVHTCAHTSFESSYEEIRNLYNLTKYSLVAIKRNKGTILEPIHVWMENNILPVL